MYWLFSEFQAGFILPSRLNRSLYKEVLRKRGTPLLELGRKKARIGSFTYPLSGSVDDQGIAAIKEILEHREHTYLFLTSHFMYGTGSRIITLSNKRPLNIIYKEVGPMRLRLD